MASFLAFEMAFELANHFEVPDTSSQTAHIPLATPSMTLSCLLSMAWLKEDMCFLLSGKKAFFQKFLQFLKFSLGICKKQGFAVSSKR